MSTLDIAGFIAAVLVMASCYVRTMIPLRIIAIASNLAFMAYGAIGDMSSILALHSLLLGLNGVRLFQAQRFLNRMRDASRFGLRFDRMLPVMRRVNGRRGHVLFSKGDRGRFVYYIVSGTVRLEDRGCELKAGQILGEMAMFTTDGRRSDTAVCATDVEVAAIDESSIWQLLHDSPEFGLYLIQRLVERSAPIEKASQEAKPSPGTMPIGDRIAAKLGAASQILTVS